MANSWTPEKEYVKKGSPSSITGKEHWDKKRLAYLNLDRDQLVLDVGCGVGGYMRAIREHL